MTDPEIIFETESVLVINKPAGLLVHANGQNTDRTVADWLLDYYPPSRGVGEVGRLADGSPFERSGIVHRLDRETSGVMILAKTEAAYCLLKAEFHERRAYKEYRAFVYGFMTDKRGVIDRPIGRSRRDSRRRSAERGAAGKCRPATTDWDLLKQGDGGTNAERFAYLKLVTKTGRTHQLRVHLKSINRPIVGDELYAPAKLRAGSDLGIDRLALHAYRLEIMLPNGIGTKSLVAPLPSVLLAAEELIAQS